MMTNSSKCEQINGGVTIIAGYPRVHKCLRVIVLCTSGKITQIHGKFTYAYAYIHTVPGHPGYPDTRAGYPGTLGTRYPAAGYQDNIYAIYVVFCDISIAIFVWKCITTMCRDI